MYTQHLYDPNHHKHFQDAEGKDKRTWEEYIGNTFNKGVKQYEEKETIPYTIETKEQGNFTPFTITLYTNNKKIFNEFKEAKRQPIMLDLQYFKMAIPDSRFAIPDSRFANHLWYGRNKDYKLADIKIKKNLNKTYHGKIRDIDFTKKTNQTPQNSKKIRLELYKNKTLFYTIEVNANTEVVETFLSHRDRDIKQPTNKEMVHYMYASYHLIFKTYCLPPTIHEVTFTNKEGNPLCYPTFEIVDIVQWDTFLSTTITIDINKSVEHVDDTYGWHNAYILDNNYRIDIKRNNEQEFLHGGTVTFQHNDTVLAIAELKHNIEGFINAIEVLIGNKKLSKLNSISNESTVEIS